MPTSIAIESKTVSEMGFQSPFQHLYLVKRVTDASGNVLDERVIRGDVGGDGSLVTQANIPLAFSKDARGTGTAALVQRHHTELNLNGRDPEAVWSLMAQHAVNIDKANLEYSFDLTGAFPGADVNSNTVVGSALHSIGLNIAFHLPTGISRGDVPLYNKIGDMLVHDVLVGGSQPDKIYGGVGNDRLSGGDGNDRLYGEVGTDVLIGGLGNDVLDGGFGADRMNGGLGSDVYYVDDGGDRVIEASLSPEGGNDRVVSTVSVNLSARSDLAGVEQVNLRGTGNLNATGNALANVLTGNSGHNLIYGRAGDDTLSGASGNDRLYGGGGNDQLRGGAGNDILNGGVGQDFLSGGKGADVFVFSKTYESLPQPAAGDFIVDFSAADLIDLKGIDADTTRAGNQAFSFIQTASFSAAGQLRFEHDLAGNSIVQADVNGDLATDFQITLQGYTQALLKGDFVL